MAHESRGVNTIVVLRKSGLHLFEDLFTNCSR